MISKLDLLQSAGMTFEQYNTGIVRSDDGHGRIGIFRDRENGGVYLAIMIEGQREWKHYRLSPARAEVVKRLIHEKLKAEK